jgi:mannosyltransferase OCH1-like enzyme
MSIGFLITSVFGYSGSDMAVQAAVRIYIKSSCQALYTNLGEFDLALTSARVMARGRLRVFLVLVSVLILAYLSAPSVQRLYYLFRLPLVWSKSSAQAIISQQHDHFDLVFSSFPDNYSTEDAGLHPLIPAKLHHIHLGSTPPPSEWLAARADCLKHHDSWEIFLWNDSNSAQFVEEHYPHLYDMWRSYPFLVQRVDALRYMTLGKHGGTLRVIPESRSG